MSTSGSSIADEVELPEDLSGSVDIEHDVDASEDVAASRGDATSDQGEKGLEEVPVSYTHLTLPTNVAV